MTLKFPKPKNGNDLDLGKIHVLNHQIGEHLTNISIMTTLFSYLPNPEDKVKATRLLITLSGKDPNQPAIFFPKEITDDVASYLIKEIEANKHKLAEKIADLSCLLPIIEDEVVTTNT